MGASASAWALGLAPEVFASLPPEIAQSSNFFNGY